MSLTSASLHAMLQRKGEQVTLRRLGSPNIDVLVWAKIAHDERDQMADGVVQATRRVIISNTEIAAAAWPGPPRKGDQIIAAGVPSSVIAPAETATIGAETVRHILQIRGG